MSEVGLTANAVITSGAIHFDLTNSATPMSFDPMLLEGSATTRRVIVDALVEHIQELELDLDVIVSTGLSSLSFAAHVSQELKIPLAYVRGTVKTYGKGKQIEGVLKQGNNVLLITDVAPKDEILHAARIVTETGGNILHSVAICSSGAPGSEPPSDAPQSILLSVDDILDAAVIERKLHWWEEKYLRNWLSSPETWSVRFEQLLNAESQEVERHLADILLKIGAVVVQPDNPFTFASGLLSPVYTDNRIILGYPNEWEWLISRFVHHIITRIGLGNVDLIAGIASSGIPHAACIAGQLGLPMVYVKSTTDGGPSIFGKVWDGARVLLIEDLISTGSSALFAASSLRSKGASVGVCFAIFTYGLSKATTAFEKADVELMTLCNLESVLTVAIEKSVIDNSGAAEVRDWAQHPEGWWARISGNEPH